MRLFFTLLLVGGCTSESVDTVSKVEDTGTPDSGGSNETGIDTGPTDNGTVTGSVVTFDGNTPTGMAVTFCQTVCYSGKTTGGGQFEFADVPAGDYKLDAIGEGLNDDWGHIRVRVLLDALQTVALPFPLFVPHQPDVQLVTYGQRSSLTFDGVTISIDGASLIEEPSDGETTLAVSAGLVLRDDVPAFWDVEPTFAVSFLPFATEVLGAFDIDVVDAMGEFAGDEFDVYAVGEHGDTEGPIGTAIRDGDTLTAMGIKPTVLTWLLFVPG